MGFKRISEADMAGKGNLGRADTPGVSAGEMQRILDELPREVLAPALNELAGQLEAPAAAGLLGAAVPAGLPEDTPQTVQGVLDAVQGGASAALAQHTARADNPHGVTAAQAGAYTRAETDAAIAQRVVEIGASDMTQAVYDPTGQRRDVFAAIGGAKAGLQTQLDTLAAANAALAQANAALGAEVQVFACTLLADGWQQLPAEGGGETEEGGSEGGGETAAAQADGETDGTGDSGGETGETEPPAVTVYTQTVPCPGLLAAYDLEAPQVPTTGVQATDAALKEGLDALCEAGNCGETLDGQLKWTCYGSHPSADLPLRLRRAAVESAPGAGGGQGPETPAGPGSGEEVQPDENL